MGLIFGFIFFLTVFFLVIKAGYRGGDTFFSNPPLAIPISISAMCGITSFITGVISIVKQKERSIFVFLSTFLGLFVLYFVLGEILYPH